MRPVAELSLCSGVSTKFREAHVSLDFPARLTRGVGSLASRQKNRKMNGSFHVLYFSLLVQRKVTKEKTPSLRNFLPYQAKTVLSAPRR